MRFCSVEDRRTADSAKTAAITGGCFVIGQQFLAFNPLEVAPPDPGTAAKCGAMLLATKRAMTIQRAQQGAVNLEFHVATQAAAANRAHSRLPWQYRVYRLKSHYYDALRPDKSR